ncbi:hypothetical protein CL621_01355 [archaeon]|nr:hypothetical protein [archaeon]|tara:strand:+ start:55 stop:339 length:285 start_codon:yes stop_codon:yes gene_type:complete
MKKEVKESKIPKIKKKINAFLIGEEGKISKQSLFKTGVILGGLALSSTLIKEVDAAHSNTLTASYGGGTGTASHHGNHGSHASHGSHSSNGWPW